MTKIMHIFGDEHVKILKVLPLTMSNAYWAYIYQGVNTQDVSLLSESNT